MYGGLIIEIMGFNCIFEIGDGFVCVEVGVLMVDVNVVLMV